MLFVHTVSVNCVCRELLTCADDWWHSCSLGLIWQGSMRSELVLAIS